MATQPEDLTDDFHDGDAPDGDDHQEDAGHDHEGDSDDDQAANDDADDEADVISFGDTSVAGEDESEGVRNLREALKREKQRARELEQRLAPAVQDIGDKPSMDDYWDRPDEYEAELLAYNERKRKADEGVTKQRELTEAVEREIADAVSSYDTQRASLKVPNFDGAHDRVVERLGEGGANILRIVAGDKAAALTYALGNSDERLTALGKYNLGKLTDVVKLAADIGRMATETRVERRKPGTQPESVHRGGGAPPRGDQRLSKLEAEARATGDRSKLIAYNAQRAK